MNLLKFTIFCVVLYINATNATNAVNNGCLKIKNRKKWGGTQPKTVEYQIIPIKYVIVHHTAGNKCSTYTSCAEQVKNIQDYHMEQLNFDDIGYNFLIGNDGNIYEGAGWHKIGAHAFGYNSKSLGVAFLGDFTSELPSTEALQVAKSLFQCGIDRGELDKDFKLLGGRQVISTASPGIELYNEIQEWDNWSSTP